MNNNGKVSFWYSWPVIILALCFFGPLGVFLIIKRVSTDRKTAIDAGKLIGGLGNVRQLDTIASTTGKSYDVVHKDVKNMIDKG